MKIFICNRHIHQQQTSELVNKINEHTGEQILIFQEKVHSEVWKNNVEEKMKKSDVVVFVIDDDTFQSQQIIWEYKLAKILNKTIIGFSISKSDNLNPEFCNDILIFRKEKNINDYLKDKCSRDKLLLIEQYKIMVNSTEKVTESRLKVNNLFFTITSSVLSVALLLEKTYGFSLPATFGVLLLTVISFLICKAWEKLINSYKDLNTGKFILIQAIEEKLETNMFSEEWDVLIKKIKYESNSVTEINIIKFFKNFIIIIGIIEIIYLWFLIQHISFYNHF